MTRVSPHRAPVLLLTLAVACTVPDEPAPVVAEPDTAAVDSTEAPQPVDSMAGIVPSNLSVIQLDPESDLEV